MSNVVQFVTRPMSTNSPPPPDTNAAPMLDCRKWQCGSCEAQVFHLWCDGVVACAECGAETLNMKTIYDEPK